MNLEQTLQQLASQYNIIGTVDLDTWYDTRETRREAWIKDTLKSLHRPAFDATDRIVLTMSRHTASPVNELIKSLQYHLNSVDITNCFVILVTNQNSDEIADILKWCNTTSADTTSITVIGYTAEEAKQIESDSRGKYRYNSSVPVHISLEELSEQEEFLLTESKTFCIYPWIHLHAYPTGHVYPCCFAEQPCSVGSARESTLKELWNSTGMKELRQNMLNDRESPACTRCYEQEKHGFFSGRRSGNKHFGHQIHRIHATQPDGHLDRFEMTYWDIRFSNLCNLRCRSCGHIFSSQWYQDQAKLAGPEWKIQNQVLNYAGRTETDMWEQLEPHLDYVEQIYFAGGEPLLMEEHYNILEELVKRKKFDVRLIYNTNFTHTDLKGRSVFEYWKQFKSVAVGASLDDSGTRGEYIRKGTDWAQVEQNRRDMIATCPNVDFYISPTLSILNARHLPQFHREWVEAGLIKPQDLNVNILQDPAHYRIDIAPKEYKEELSTIYLNHLMWLRDRDPLNRATQGFESAIAFMNATDNTHLIDSFWRKTNELDDIRGEHILTVIPELKALK